MKSNKKKIIITISDVTTYWEDPRVFVNVFLLAHCTAHKTLTLGLLVLQYLQRRICPVVCNLSNIPYVSNVFFVILLFLCVLITRNLAVFILLLPVIRLNLCYYFHFNDLRRRAPSLNMSSGPQCICDATDKRKKSRSEKSPRKSKFNEYRRMSV